MSRNILVSAVLMAASHGAFAAPVVIDSEQKALAAIATANSVQNAPRHQLWIGTDFARGKIENALQLLNATTSPAALMRNPNGIQLPCALSGNLVARMPRSFPRTLKLQWTACRFLDADGRVRERNGPAEALLFSDTFAPERIAGIRMGAGGTDFVESRLIDEPDQLTLKSRSTSLRITGIVPMTREFPVYGLFVGPFAFEQSGFYREHSDTPYPPGAPPTNSDSLISYEFLVVSGATTYANSRTLLDEQLQLRWGTISNASFLGGYPTGEGGMSFENLRVRSEVDFTTFTQKQWLDGRVDYDWNSAFSASCLSGLYAFHTQTPLTGPWLSGAYASGRLQINGALRAAFFSAPNTPAPLPVPQNGMLAHVNLSGVGTFNYDAPSVHSLAFSSGCF